MAEHAGVVSKSAALLVCVSPCYRNMRQFKTVILSTRSVRNKTYQLISTTRCSSLPFHRTDNRVSLAGPLEAAMLLTLRNNRNTTGKL